MAKLVEVKMSNRHLHNVFDHLTSRSLLINFSICIPAYSTNRPPMFNSLKQNKRFAYQMKHVRSNTQALQVVICFLFDSDSYLGVLLPDKSQSVYLFNLLDNTISVLSLQQHISFVTQHCVSSVN